MWALPQRGREDLVSRSGERILGLLAIAVGLVLAFLAGIEADIPPVALYLITVGVIGWVAYYFLVVRPSVTGVKRPRRYGDRETE